MSGAIHQGLVRLFESRPEILRALLQGQLPLPAGTTRPTSTDLTELSVAERHADVVLEIGGPPPSAALIVEPQLSIDESKREVSWPQYLAGGRARLHCPTFLVVVALDTNVANWARRRIDLGGGSVDPIVIGPAELSPITDLAMAKRHPELAWMGTLAHAAEPGGEQMAFAAMEALDRLPGELARICADILMVSVPDRVRAALEDPMAARNYEYQSDFAKRYVAQGRAQGREEGRSALQHVLLAQLTQRGFEVPPSLRERILATEDLGQLERWTLRAMSAAVLQDVFE